MQKGEERSKKRRKGQREIVIKAILWPELKYLHIILNLGETQYMRFSSQDCCSLQKTIDKSEGLPR